MSFWLESQISLVRIVKAPRELGILPGKKMNYQTLANKVKLLPRKTVSVMDALGKVLGEGALDLTVGTELDAQAIKRLEDNDVRNVMVVDGLEIEAVTTPMSRVVNESSDWLASLNHRYLKTSLKDAASQGKRSNIHGFNPVTAYAYGAEFGEGKVDGRY